MIKSKCYKLIMLLAFIPLIGCNSGSTDSLQSSEVYNDSTTESTSANESTSIIDVLKEYESLEISWDDLADNEEGFLIERSVGGDDDFIILTSVDANQISYVDSNVLSNNTYCYRIGAYNESGIAYSDISCNNNN
ncbi:fibronectin type III domain-containing protein [Psychromonas sp. L1A2]|uniref:fibronectin type III domain-containing protein n=1 Tax=Psychromonas sp. L1A2 TaxID=2686356 RepID=UPI00135A04D7|nr:fibronectin type III domain-containing protein [Psychromonas sp. L1A2]